MRNFKKVVAAGLALLMLALSVNVSFAAESYTDKEAVVVAKVNAAGIMTGTDKGFEPSKTLTRAEAAAIMVRMKGISEDTVKQNAGSTLFTDVAASHWAAGYVNVASNYGIIKGVGANKFAPEKEVTVAEFYTMAIRALNAGQLVEAEGTWPTNYVNFAIENDLAEDVAQLYTAASTRMTAATIVANTLEAEMWEKQGYKSNGEVEFRPSGKTILNNVLKIEEVKNVSFANISVKENEADATQTVVAPAVAKWTATSVDFNKSANLSTAKLGQKYTVWFDKEEEEIVGFWVPEETNSIVFTDIKADYASNKVKLEVEGKEKEYDVATWATGTTAFTLNGVEKTAWTDLKKGDMPRFGVAYFDANNKKIEKVYVEYYERYGVVKEVKNNKIIFDTNVKGNLGQTITIETKDDSKKEYLVTKDGKSIDVADIQEGDVVFYYSYAPKTGYLTYVIDVYTEEVAGKIKSKSGNEFTVDGTKYKALNSTVAGYFKAGDEGTFYMNQAGKAVLFDKEATKAGDLMLVSAYRSSKDKYTNEDVIEVKLSTIDGTLSDWTEVNLKKSYEEVNSAKLIKHTNDKYYEDKDKDGKLTAADHTSAGDATDPFVPGDATAITLASNFAAAIKAGLYNAKISDNKVVFTKQTDDKSRANVLEAIKFIDEDEEDTIYAYKSTGDHVGQDYVVNSNAKVFEIVSNDEDGIDEIFTLKEVNLDDLDDINKAAADKKIAFISDIDYDDLTVGLIVLKENESTIKTDRKWAYILKKSTYSDDDNDKLDEEYEVVFAGESTKTILHADGKSLVKDHVYELAIEGDEIKSYKDTFAAGEVLTQSSAGAHNFINKIYGNGDLGLMLAVAATTDLDTVVPDRKKVANDVIVVLVDKDGKNTISDLDAISIFDNAKDADNVVSAAELKEQDGRIVNYVTYLCDGITKIVAIQYADYDLD